MNRKMNIKRLSMRFSDGGAQPPAEPAPTPQPAPAPQPTPTPTPAPAPGITPPQAVNVDINQIIKQAEEKAAEVAEKRAEGAFKSMLQQQGLDAETISKMTEEWKSKQVTPEQIIQAKEAEIAARDGTISQLTAQIEAERQEKIALSKGVPLNSEDEALKEKANACITLAKTYMTDNVPFDSALEKALEIISFKQPDPSPASPVPRFAGGEPAVVNKTEAEELKAQMERAKRLNNTAEMVRITRVAQEKKINIF